MNKFGINFIFFTFLSTYQPLVQLAVMSFLHRKWLGSLYSALRFALRMCFSTTGS
jgi:hypothetical protein